MPYATDARLLVLIPDASDIDEEIRTAVLALAADMIDRELFGKRTELAHAYLTAHFLAVQTGSLGGVTGNVTGRRAGEVSISYATATNSMDSDLAATRWGRAFLSIQNGVAIGPLVCFA
jgi:hypothetical protein